MKYFLLLTSRTWAFAFLVYLSGFDATLNGQNLTADQKRQLQTLSPEQRNLLLQRLNGGQNLIDPPVELNREVGEDREIRADAPSNSGDDELSEVDGRNEKTTPQILSEYEFELEIDVLRIETMLKEVQADDQDQRLRLEKRLDRTKELLEKVRLLQLTEIEREVGGIETPQEDELQPFGLDFFTDPPSTFSPVENAPVPPDYVVGPGDWVEIQIFGKENRQHVLPINRDGRIQFPDIGPINVFEKGTDFDSMRAVLQDKILESFGEGTQSSISMGPLRPVRTFLLGDVAAPGSYLVGSLSTITNALFACGGITELGSMRKVQLKRKGELIVQLDLYDLLLKGDTSGDQQVRPGDVIFAPPVGSVVGVKGAVRRPALYELKDENQLGQLLELAGGLLPSSAVNLCRVERIVKSGRREIINVDLSQPAGLAFALQDGDQVEIYSSLDKLQEIVSLHGHVERREDFQWLPGLRLTSLVPDKDSLLDKPDLDYAMIRRENLDTGEISVIAFQPRVAFANHGSVDDPELQAKDQIFFFGLEDSESRDEIVEKLLDELRTQTRPGTKASLISVSGPVHFPGEYPLADGMRVSDLIRAGGNMKDDAYVLSAELTRYRYEADGSIGIEHLTIDSLSAIAEDPQRDLLLQPYDNLRIKPLPDWAERGTVEIRGEVRFPGVYPVRRGETLSEVLKRAGGFTEHAFPDGAVFLRESLKTKEAARKEELMARLEADLALLSVEKASGDALQAGSLAQSLLAQLRKTDAVGRMVIDLSAVAEGRADQPLLLENGDKLIVPIRPQEVMVIGEVQHPTSHLFKKRMNLKGYVGLSGGFTYKADQKRVFVVKANGSVGNTRGSSWFPTGNTGIHPGDTVVIPLDVDRGQGLKKIANVTQIVYQMALAAAAVNSF